MFDLTKSTPLVDGDGNLPTEFQIQASYIVAAKKGEQQPTPQPKRGFLSRVLNTPVAESQPEQVIDMDLLGIGYKGGKVVGCSRPEFSDAFDGSFVHTGDQSATAGNKATESFIVQPGKIPHDVDALVVALVSYEDSTAFGRIDQVTLELPGTNIPKSRQSIEEGSQARMLFYMARDNRRDGGWAWGTLDVTLGQAKEWQQVARDGRDQIQRAIAS